MKNQLIFVYNAKSGFFNTFADIAHKALSPATYQCSLCKITHDLFNEKKEWTQFVNGLKVDCEFLHIDEFRKKYDSDVTNFPAIFMAGFGEIKLLAGRGEINRMRDLAELQELVQSIAGELEKI